MSYIAIATEYVRGHEMDTTIIGRFTTREAALAAAKSHREYEDARTIEKGWRCRSVECYVLPNSPDSIWYSPDES